LILLLIGVMGGVFIVPINAELQSLGVDSIGTGHAVAIQGFFSQHCDAMCASHLRLRDNAIPQSSGGNMVFREFIFYRHFCAELFSFFYQKKPFMMIIRPCYDS